MSNLIEILKKETESLRVQYLEFTEKNARKTFAYNEERLKWSIDKWYDFFNVKYTYEQKRQINFTTSHYEDKSVLVIDNQEYHNKRLYKCRDAFHKCKVLIERGLDVFINSELKFAELHYQNSILKLAKRIELKGLNQDNLTVVTSHIGVNIDTRLTDGEKTVRAFTILAEGEIQRPHFRYLIK